MSAETGRGQARRDHSRGPPRKRTPPSLRQGLTAPVEPLTIETHPGLILGQQGAGAAVHG
jgi:hypothetical protein